MPYKTELEFLRSALKKQRLQVMMIDPAAEPAKQLEEHLRDAQSISEEYERIIRQIVRSIRANAIFKMEDRFLCRYLFLQLPENGAILAVGPYFTRELTHEQLLEQAEQSGVSPRQFRRVENYFSAVPVISNEMFLLALVETFAEKLWGSSESYTIIDLNQELAEVSMSLPSRERMMHAGDPEQDMRMMEERYAHENELMQAVSHGLTHKAERLFAGFSNLSFERRQAEPVRNMKNYCIVMNTLMRKAAEQGGVHPVHLDQVSSSFAHRIETMPSEAAVQTLMEEILHSYCRLVKKYATQNYSAPVQKAVIRIESDLAGDLSLKALADAQGINASYLSSLFKKETGQTVTDYVNEKRIQLAAKLLATTRLQVQTVALHCGISDVNYFSKIFKRYVKKTPKEYRREIQAQIAVGKR